MQELTLDIKVMREDRRMRQMQEILNYFKSILFGIERDTNGKNYNPEYALDANEVKFAALWEIAKEKNQTIIEAMESVNLFVAGGQYASKDEAITEALQKSQESNKPSLIYFNYGEGEGAHWTTFAILPKDQAIEVIAVNSSETLKKGQYEEFSKEIKEKVQEFARRENKEFSFQDGTVNRQYANCCGLSCALASSEIMKYYDSNEKDIKQFQPQPDIDKLKEQYLSQGYRTFTVISQLRDLMGDEIMGDVNLFDMTEKRALDFEAELFGIQKENYTSQESLSQAITDKTKVLKQVSDDYLLALKLQGEELFQAGELDIASKDNEQKIIEKMQVIEEDKWQRKISSDREKSTEITK